MVVLIFVSLFMVSLVKCKAQFPIIYRCAVFNMISLLVLIVPYLLELKLEYLSPLITLLYLSCYLSFLFGGLRSWVKGSDFGKWYFIAWCLPVVFAVTMLVLSIDTDLAFGPIFVIEHALLAFILAEKINQKKRSLMEIGIRSYGIYRHSNRVCS